MKWETSNFDKMFTFYNGKAIKAKDSGKYPVYGSNGIIGYSDNYLYENAIILGRVGAYCGSVMRCNKEFWASDNTLVIKSKNSDIRFCYYMLQTLQLNNYAGGSAQPLITQTILKKLLYPLPPLHTQKKLLLFCLVMTA